MTARTRQLAPGLLLALGVAIVGVVVHRRVSVVSPHVIAVGFGILGATFGRIDTILVPGLRFAAKKVLRAGMGAHFGLQQIGRASCRERV